MTEKQSSKRRAHNPDGIFKADDPSTPDINEAWEPVASADAMQIPSSVLPGLDDDPVDEYSLAPPVLPSPKPQAGRARRLASGQWVTP